MANSKHGVEYVVDDRDSPNSHRMGVKQLLAGLVILLAATLAPVAPAQANPGHLYYGWSAARVAEHTNCQDFYARKPTKMFISTGICWLGGTERVNIMTFKNKDQMAKYAALIMVLLPKQWFAAGSGALIVAKDGNYAAAAAGKKALGNAIILQGRRDG